MEYGIIEFLTLIGSLGVILFGLKLISESLQKIAGEKMRGLLQTMPSTTTKGILAGLIVTMVIQSSTATTLMVVGFVNVGLLSLVQSIGIIMGANIGSTFTAWVVSILGFKYDFISLAVPIIGFGVPLILTKKSLLRSLGELIIGFSLLFIGLDFLKLNAGNINHLPELKSFLVYTSNLGFYSVLIFVVLGIFFSLGLQSSSAALVFTFVLSSAGLISFPNAIAMVLGENVGTSIIANFAARAANTSAKRAARVHFILNLFGVIWVLLFFSPLISLFYSVLDLSTPTLLINSSTLPIALCIFHTGFNITNTLILVWFIPLIVKIVGKMVPAKDSEEEKRRLMHLGIGLLSTAEFSLIQAKKEIIVYAKRSYKMFGFVKDFFLEKNEKNLEIIYQRIEKYENISDRVEVEIATYLSKISVNKLSDSTTRVVQSMFKIISDIESISDSNFSIARILRRKHESNIWFTEDMNSKIQKMFDLIDEAFNIMIENINKGHAQINLAPAYDIENRINLLRNQLKEDYIKEAESNKYNYSSGVIYHDLFSVLEKLGDYLINVSKDLSETQVVKKKF